MKIKSKLKSKFIPVNRPKVFSNDIKSVVKVLRENWISGDGPYVKKFEENFAKFHKKKYAISVSNGTAALEVALKSLNLKKGSEIIIPAFSIISTALCVVKNNLKPILVDVDLDTWNMNPEEILKKINSKTKAIIITHIYGFPVDMSRVLKIAKRKKIFIIEDAAEVIGQRYKNRLCGSFGDVSTFSFYANKHITTGEGGILLTDSKNFYEEAKKIRNLDFDNKKRFQHENLYWNYRLSGLQAALGNSQIKKLDKTINFKIKQGNYYRYLLSDALDFIELPLEEHNGTLNHYWVFGILLKKENVRDKLIEELLKEGIETRPFFWPLHLQPVIKDISKENKNLIISEKLGRNGLYIPTGRHITPKLQKKIVKILLEKLREI